MSSGEAAEIVLADTSVLLNLAFVERLDLLGALEDYRFRIPEEVAAEVRQPEQRSLLDRALSAGHLERARITRLPVIEHFQTLRQDLKLGRGEAACLALAYARGWMVASDEKRAFRREARKLLGERRLLTTPSLFVLGIRQAYWSVAEADQAKAILERNRFRMRFSSFDELVRRKSLKE